MKKKYIIYLPNLLTLFRMAITPFFVVFLLKQTFQMTFLATGVFLVASLTDYLDGVIARRYNAISQWGTFMDPLSDKLITGAAFITFSFLTIIFIPLWIVTIIIAREVFVTVMRIIAIQKSTPIQTESSGKLKTAFQMFSIIIILIILMMGQYHLQRLTWIGTEYKLQFWRWIYGDHWGSVLFYLPPIMVACSAVLAVFSMIQYITRNRVLFERK